MNHVLTTPRLHDMARTLGLVRRDLDQLIAPELSTATAQSALAMIGKLLDLLSQELTTDPVGDTTMREESVSAVRTALSLSPQAGDEMLSRNIAEQSRQVAGNDGDPAALLRLLEVAATHDRVTADPAVWRGYDALSAARAVRDAGRSDATWDAAYQDSGAGARGAGSDRVGGHKQREFAPAELARYLLESGRLMGPVQIRRLERLPGGLSKGTYVVELDIDEAGASPRRESWILRKDLSFTPLQTRVIDEFPLLSALYQRGLAIPEPLWCEPDPAHLGAPMIAVRRVPGSGDMAQWAQQPDQARAIALSAARVLASIHAVEWSTLPKMQTDAPGCSGNTPLDVLAHVEAFWQSVRVEPDPLVELVFGWLRRNAPAQGLRMLVHGDYGLHNLLVENGAVNAVLDWEFAHVGDPREDLAYARPFVEKVVPWSEFAREYEQAGGVSSDDSALRFYTVLGTMRNALGCMKILHSLRHCDPGIDSKFVYVGRSYAQQLLRAAAQLTGALTPS